MTENALVPVQSEILTRVRAIEELRTSVFLAGVHFGEPYAGAGKPVLLKPGAETIMARFHLWPEFHERTVVERWDTTPPLFHYRYECRLINRESGEVWGAGIGSCNSMEDKYRWRKQARRCPICGAEAIRRSGFPENVPPQQRGWYCHTKSGGCNAKFAADDHRITDQQEGKVPNDDVFTLVNTLDKMAQKRALVAAVLVATGASAYFTQDVEDFPEYGAIIEQPTVVVHEDTPADSGPPEPAPIPAPRNGGNGNGWDPATSADPFKASIWEKISARLIADGIASNKEHAAGKLRKSLHDAGLIEVEDAAWPTIYALTISAADVWALIMGRELAEDDGEPAAPALCTNCGVEPAVETPLGTEFCDTCAHRMTK